MELCKFDFKPSNADKKFSSLDQFLWYMNEEDIFDSFPGIGNVITSDVVLAVSYLSDIETAKVLVSNFHYKSYKHKELEMAFGKKIYCL